MGANPLGVAFLECSIKIGARTNEYKRELKNLQIQGKFLLFRRISFAYSVAILREHVS